MTSLESQWSNCESYTTESEESVAPPQLKNQDWFRIFDNFGSVPQQSPSFIKSLCLASNPQPLILLSDRSAVSIFRREEKVAISEMGGAGVMLVAKGKVDLGDFFERVIRALKVETLYFPLLYQDILKNQCTNIPSNALFYERRPSPFICWENRGADVWQRCESRLGIRAKRRLKKFEKAGASVLTMEGKDAVEAIAAVERKSWKAKYHVDLFSRDQFKLVKNLVENKSLLVRVVLIESNPIAYRIDFRVKDTVFCYKWSYDEDVRRLSPGFYLIAKDLIETYGNEPLKMIDLYGSPDSLKDTVSSGSRKRFDIIWPDSPQARQISQERRQHDARAAKVYAENMGIRYSVEVNL